MTVKLGMTHAQLINAINSDIDLIKDQGSKIITKEFPASGTETSSVQLDTKCQGKDYMFVFMDYGILEPSKYSLSSDGLTVNFSPAIPANHKIIIRYFTPGFSFTNYVTDEFQSNLLNYTTNRILEIPQDIKLELNNGTLTLKAGSKVYVPNGFKADGTTPKFDVVVIESDIIDAPDSARQAMVWCRKLNGKYYIDSPLPPTFCYSGSTAPTSFYVGKLALWYDTNTNLIKYTKDGGATWDNQGHSLPLAIVTETTTAYISIDQIFNGFGYIGSTVFVLPGVKVQAPNGKNEDGTYKSNILTQSSVGLTTFPEDAIGALVVRPNSDIPLFASPWHFDSENGYISTSDNVPTNNGACILCGYLRIESLKVVDFTFGNVDSVVNSNASNFSQAGRSYLSGLGMPSSRYINLTLGASGSTYTAPANGWFSCVFICGNTGGHVNAFVVDRSIGFYDDVAANGAKKFYLPALKGDKMYFSYPSANTSSSDWYFHFIYAEGEN